MKEIGLVMGSVSGSIFVYDFDGELSNWIEKTFYLYLKDFLAKAEFL